MKQQIVAYNCFLFYFFLRLWYTSQMWRSLQDRTYQIRKAWATCSWNRVETHTRYDARMMERACTAFYRAVLNQIITIFNRLMNFYCIILFRLNTFWTSNFKYKPTLYDYVLHRKSRFLRLIVVFNIFLTGIHNA